MILTGEILIIVTSQLATIDLKRSTKTPPNIEPLIQISKTN
jgi:hypothetical protein